MINEFLDIIFPKSCLECGKQGEGYICSTCFSLLESKVKSQKNKASSECYDVLIYIDNYKSKIRSKILSMKFNSKAYIAEYFVDILIRNEKITKYLKRFDMIIPVPMQKNKKMERGYNQTELLGIELEKNLNVPCKVDLLIKIKNNRTQSLLKSKERLENVKNVFKIINTEEIKGKNIIIIDDIFTTGATIKECSKLLKLSGAKKICALVIAKD
jgi:ComF family protein